MSINFLVSIIIIYIWGLLTGVPQLQDHLMICWLATQQTQWWRKQNLPYSARTKKRLTEWSHMLVIDWSQLRTIQLTSWSHWLWSGLPVGSPTIYCMAPSLKPLKIIIHLHTFSQQPRGEISGRVLDSRPRGRGFEPHRRHCVVVLEQDTFILA